MHKHLILTPTLLLELILITCLFGIGSALAINATTPIGGQSSWAAQEGVGGTENLEVVDYSFNYNAELTAVESVNLVLANRDASASHSGLALVAVGNDANTVTETGGGADPVMVPAGEEVEATVVLGDALDLIDLDWIRVMIEEA